MWSTTPFFVLLVALGAIDAAPKLGSFGSNHNPYADVVAIMGRKPASNFGILQLGGGYGIAKRLAPSSNIKYDTKSEKYRRGPLNGLIPGGAFGRAARSNCIRYECRSPTYERFIKILKEKNRRYFPFELENRNDSDSATVKDGPEKMPISIDVYTPYQYQQLSASNKYI